MHKSRDVLFERVNCGGEEVFGERGDCVGEESRF